MPTGLAYGVAGGFLLTLFFAGVWMLERARARRAHSLAFEDAVTSLSNRTAFEHQLALDWQRFERYGRPLGVVVLDLDDFKKVNDELGHAAGDRVLAEAAEVIDGRVRGSDLAARIGGDEFAVITTETTIAGLERLGENLGEELEAAGIAVSVGWAPADVDLDGGPTELLDRADRAMYETKRARLAAPARSVSRRAAVPDPV